MRLLLLSTILCMVIATCASAAVPASITVQGRLTDSLGVPLPTGMKGFYFRVFNAPVGGSEIWSGEDQLVPTDADGLWSAQVGAIVGLPTSVFADTVRWLDINVNGTQLPRVRLVTGPYAHRVSTVDGATGGNITSKVSIGPGHTNPGVDAFVAGNGNESSGNYSSVGGGTVNGATGEASVVGGGVNNWASGDHSAVGGGHSNSADSAFAVVGGGGENSATGRHSTVGGGSLNEASGRAAAVVGGERNSARGNRSFVGAGGGPNAFDTNSALGDQSAIIAGTSNIVIGDKAFIGAGSSNSVTGVGAHSSCIVAGQSNDVDGLCAAVVGGRSNKAKGSMSFVGGGGQPTAVPGDSNVASGIASAIVCGIGNVASDSCSFVGAGRDNTASGKFAAIAGGLLNTAAGEYAFAAGRRAKSNHSGSFVWGDGTNADFASTNQNQFLVRASGGVGIGTNDPEGPLHVQKGSAGAVTANGNSVAVFESSTSGGWISILGPATQERGLLFSEPGASVAGAIVFDQGGGGDDLGFRTGGNVTNMTLDATGNLTVVGCVDGNNTACASDIRFKKQIATISNPEELISRLRGVTYEWRTGEFPDRHFESGTQYGVVAQEVREVIPEIVREREDGYLSVEYTSLVPILLEAIKEQQRVIEKQNDRIANLEKKLEQ